eukprot:TRINITY_DN308_c0_g2_i13.p1 TRINITY_DN308_c0_g2~~TRINITY_DN308_c0_g2_i13.p1  ORF type:complete len:781 (-),score=117.95 TRINITY_DN308_c0_g2_i13:15-2357(-)
MESKQSEFTGDLSTEIGKLVADGKMTESQIQDFLNFVGNRTQTEKVIQVLYQNKEKKILVRKDTNLVQTLINVFALDETSKLVLFKSDISIDINFGTVEDKQIYNLQVTPLSITPDLRTILKDFEKDFSLVPFEHLNPWIPRRIRGVEGRGGSLEEELLTFEKDNRSNSQSTDKHLHYFMYCINGSGYGKTWCGHYVPHFLRTMYPNIPIAYCFLDFTQGDYDSVVNSQSSQIAMGLLVAARMIFKCDLHDLLVKVPTDKYVAFEFNRVMEWISKVTKRSYDNPNLLFVFHFDEIQKFLKEEKDREKMDIQARKVKDLLHVIARYMCSTTTSVKSCATLNNMLIYPVITGTSTKGFKEEVTDYGSIHIELEPFNFSESLNFLEKNGIVHSRWIQQSNFKRLVKCCGGLPRCLKLLQSILKKNSFDYPLPNSDTYFGELVQKLFKIYKFQEQLPIFGCLDNLQVVIALAVNAIRVPLELELYNDVTIEDIMKKGVILLRSSKRGGFKVVLPMVYIHCLNISFNIFPILFEQVFKKPWDWQDFENWDCDYQLIKNNTCFWLSNMTFGLKPNKNNKKPLFVLPKIRTTLGTLFNCKNIHQEKEIQLCEIRSVALEKKQFLAKSMQKPQILIDTNIGQIEQQDFKYYSFRCLAGNPSVDARVFYEATSNDKNQKPWMVCRQFKHRMNNETKMSFEQILSNYRAWSENTTPYFDSYRCFYVLITNQQVDDSVIDQVTKRLPEMSVVYYQEFGKYCPLTFSLYSIFDDDKDQVKEEMHHVLTTPIK